MNPKTYTTFEAAEILGVQPTTVIKWHNQGRIKAYKTPGGHRRILEVDLFIFIQEYEFPVGEELIQRFAEWSKK